VREVPTVLAESDADELRALQRKAYSRDGLMADHEMKRLRELEDRRRSLSAPAESPSSSEDSADERPESPHDDAPDQGEDDEQAFAQAADPVPATSNARSTVRRALRQYRVGVSVLAVLLLATGVITGWALFAPRADGIVLTAAQQERRDVLAAADFDPGSLRAVARDENALAWYATKEDATFVCLILDVGEQSQSSCLRGGDVGRGLSVSFPIARDDSGDDPSGMEGVGATMLVSTAGEPMVALQRWTMSPTSSSQFAGEERARAEELADEGFAFSIAILGYFRSAPVWIGDRFSEQGDIEKCLIVDARDQTTCMPLAAALESGIGTRVDDVGVADGAVVGSSMLEARFTRWQTPYLVVTAAPAQLSVTPGDSVLVEAPPGDPIEVEPPGRGTGG
jgi:hypothetical protein